MLNPTEQAVAEIWRELLGHRVSDANDAFFTLGGRHRDVVPMVGRLRAAFGVDIPLWAPVEYPRLSDLAAHIDSLTAAAPKAIPVLAPVARTGGPLPASFAQERLWFTEQLAPGEPQYHVPVYERLTGPLDADAMNWALAEIMRRHEVLRSGLTDRDGELAQVVHPPPLHPLRTISLSSLSGAEREEELRRLAEREYRAPFDLSTGPMLRATLVRLAEDDHALLLTFHHLAHDGWSLGLFRAELAALYDAARAGLPSPLPEPPLQYADYAAWLRGLDFDPGIAFWRERLTPVAAAPPLPTDFPRPRRMNGPGRLIPIEVGERASHRVRELGRRLAVTPFMVLAAALVMALPESPRVVIGADVANRPEPALEGLLGFFVNQIVLCVEMPADREPAALLDRVRATVLEALTHQHVPFEQVVRAVNPPRSSRHHPLFQVKLVLNNTPGQGHRLTGLVSRPIPMNIDTARFDFALVLHDEVRGFHGFAEYRTDLFADSTIGGLLDRFHAALDRLAAAGGQDG